MLRKPEGVGGAGNPPRDSGRYSGRIDESLFFIRYTNSLQVEKTMSEGLEPSGEVIKKSGTRDDIVLLIRVVEIISRMKWMKWIYIVNKRDWMLAL